ncbi:MAG: HEPN domain-containing protein [Magnetospirillum sp. WYHS-4]
MSVTRRIDALLEIAEEDARAAGVLSVALNRNAAYHCQQAIEKVMRAVLLHRGIEAGLEHRLDVLLGKIPDDNPWKTMLKPFDVYTPYATAFRYPTPGGRIPNPPSSEKTNADAKMIQEIIGVARLELLAEGR